jgi:hypothetical protein
VVDGLYVTFFITQEHVICSDSSKFAKDGLECKLHLLSKVALYTVLKWMNLKCNLPAFSVLSTKTRSLVLGSLLSIVWTYDKLQGFAVITEYNKYQLLALKHHGAIMLSGGMRSGWGGVTWLSPDTPWFRRICNITKLQKLCAIK